MRLSGRDVFFLSGTDEHGQKVEQSAANKGVDPQTFVDDSSVNFRQLLDLLNISVDEFIRTTQADHKASVQVRYLIALCNLVAKCPDLIAVHTLSFSIASLEHSG